MLPNNITETCKNHCLKILHCTWQLNGKITNYDWTMYSCPGSEKKRLSLLCFCNSHQQQMHTTNTHKTFYRHLKPSAVTCSSSPCTPICSRAETNRPARPLPAPGCEQEVASLQHMSQDFIDATILQQYELLQVSFECNPST